MEGGKNDSSKLSILLQTRIYQTYNRSRIIGDREEEQIGERSRRERNGGKENCGRRRFIGSVKMMEAATILVEGGV